MSVVEGHRPTPLPDQAVNRKKAKYLVDEMMEILYRKGAYHWLELADRSGGFECEMALFHEIFAQIQNNSV